MSCGAGYPDKPCPFGFAGRVTRLSCGPCKHFLPPKHILAWCKLYDREGIICERPIADCETCPEKNVRGPGRPPTGRIDWNNPEDVKVYQRDLMKKRREEGRHKDKPQSAEYHRSYYAANREHILERRRARRKLKREQGGSKV